jgi:hypothetical protein
MSLIKSVDVTLTRKAKKGGGDRYEGAGMVIYIPQDISRANGSAINTIRIKFEEVSNV